MTPFSALSPHWRRRLWRVGSQVAHKKAYVLHVGSISSIVANARVAKFWDDAAYCPLRSSKCHTRSPSVLASLSGAMVSMAVLLLVDVLV